ncbi:mgs207 protein [Diplodia corticola]|uniref:Mgs207 protein n=1 Tax=Diplodia corticola TaxID=236234 RepID=A0A1J9R8S5_9PEZI|nr:mgs207 protein [Diplodia corticola]OJD36921.1 mgs207 protein [Diplodia corticola]
MTTRSIEKQQLRSGVIGFSGVALATAAMFSWSYRALPDLFAQRIRVEKEPVYTVEETAEKRARTVKHLLQANHSIYSVIYHNLEFHNHTPHILGSAYILGATDEHLNEVYDVETETLEKWTDSPGEITESNWREHFGQREYQRAYMDFFEDQIPKHGHDWRAMTEKYLFEGPNPLINNIICGLGHALIHLGYAYELSSRTLAPEALVLATCFHNAQHKYLDDPSYTRPPPASNPPSSSPLELLARLRRDPRFDDADDALFIGGPDDNDDDNENNSSKGGAGDDANIEALLASPAHEAAVLEYWNALAVPAADPTAIFAGVQRAAVELLVATKPESSSSSASGSRRDDNSKYDFFLVHTLTTSHALRHLLPGLPARWHVPLVRQWWLLVVSVYVAQGRPAVERGRVERVDVAGKGWDGFVVGEAALRGRWRNDAHFVKALRAMKNAADTWGDPDQFFLKAAVRFATDFDGWGGFGRAEVERTDERKQTRMGTISPDDLELAALAQAGE